MTTHRAILPLSVTKCVSAPGKCARQQHCARFQVAHEKGRPVEDFSLSGYCWAFIAIDYREPTPARRVHPPIGSGV